MKYYFAECPHCRNKNSYNAEDIQGTDPAWKDITPQSKTTAREYWVKCRNCMKDFKLQVGGENSDGKR